MDKFFSRRPTFCAALLARPIGHAKNWWSKPKCTLDPDQLKTLLYVLFYLNRTWSFHFKCVSIKSFYSILKIKSATEALITICRNLSKQTFLGAAADSWLKNGKRWLKRSYPLLVSIFKYFYLDFENCNVSSCKDTSWAQPTN